MFGIRVYLDKEADGPSTGDPMFTLYDSPIEATGSSITGVIIDLNNEKIGRGARPAPTNPALPPTVAEDDQSADE